MTHPGDDEATIVARRRPARRLQRLLAAGLLCAVAAGAAAWVFRAPPPPAAAGMTDEAGLLATVPDAPLARQFAPVPQILVLSFPTLEAQGAALNRAAALVEKSGLPRDRVLDDAALARAIAASGDTAATYYYGHDYRVADLDRFFALADRDGVALNDAELMVRQLIAQGDAAALISVPPLDLARGIDGPARASILRHELSHGVYFTDPAYAASARVLWEGTLSEGERADVRGFLAAGGYDTAQEDLMRNEAQAFLMHTRDPRYFGAAAVGWTPARLRALRTAFLAAMPPGWLRDHTAAD